jgi:hypothetical protein
MTVSGGITLDIDLNNFGLEVKNGARIVINNGAKIE